MVTKNPEGVVSVIFSGPLISTPVWQRDANILLGKMPENLQDTIRKYEALKEFKAPNYLAATDSFYSRYMTVMPFKPFKRPDCKGSKGFNEAIYNYMWGPTEFTATGTLRTFDREKDLSEINVPVLFIAGRFDEARPETMYQFQKLTPNAKVVIIENAGHAKIYDQPEATTQAIHQFIIEVEN